MSASEQPASLSVGEAVTVLHVADDPDVLAVTAASLERAEENFEVVTARGATEGLDRLADRDVDCVVSDYQMPAMDGLAFLDAVRESYPDLPFILFTGTDQYDILANRVANAVGRHRTAREHARVHQALETATEGIAILDAEGQYVYVNESYADLYDRSPEGLVGERWEDLYPEAQVERFHEEILPRVRDSGEWTGRSRGRRADGSTFVEQLSLTDLADGGHVCVVRDITERVERERHLQRERGFFIADDGPGIPPGERDDVFDAGYSTSREGTGFGLTIVHRIAEAHGWSVAVTGSADGGARFEITGVEAVE